MNGETSQMTTGAHLPHSEVGSYKSYDHFAYFAVKEMQV
jgi:hypothetical protein